ncbi:MAG: hypothetical protein CMJ78_03755 [Planctomycetaceae bacterium]|nr:hypothetical protein [Planctomycetaceae bacterium]
MQFSSSSAITPDGVDLHVREFQPLAFDSADGRTLVIVHGASEHGERYVHVAKFFVDRGWRVIVGDQRGHGLSGGVPMYVDRFDRYLADLDILWDNFGLDDQRTALMGHSFGSLVSIRFAQTRPDKMSALVPLAPLLGLRVQIPRSTLALGKLMSFVAPKTRFTTKVNPEHTTRSREILEQRASDPLIHRRITARWFFQMKAALKRSWEDAGQLKMPVFILQGSADQIVDPLAVEPWFENVASDDKLLRMFPAHYHELHNEPTKFDILNIVADWLDERVGTADALRN